MKWWCPWTRINAKMEHELTARWNVTCDMRFRKAWMVKVFRLRHNEMQCLTASMAQSADHPIGESVSPSPILSYLFSGSMLALFLSFSFPHTYTTSLTFQLWQPTLHGTKALFLWLSVSPSLVKRYLFTCNIITIIPALVFNKHSSFIGLHYLVHWFIRIR